MKYISFPVIIHIPIPENPSQDFRADATSRVLSVTDHLPQGNVVALAEDFTDGFNETTELDDLPLNLRASCPMFEQFQGVAPSEDETWEKFDNLGIGE